MGAHDNLVWGRDNRKFRCGGIRITQVLPVYIVASFPGLLSHVRCDRKPGNEAIYSYPIDAVKSSTATAATGSTARIGQKR